MTQKSGKREQRRARQRQQQMKGSLLWGGVGVAVLAIIGFIVWQGLRPRTGEKISIMSSSHITVDSDPGEYNSDPPTSGPHYPEEAQAGFYETNNYQYPAAYLVHNLEHGYVIFWYNCADLSESACSELKSQIKAVMDEVNNVKVIAYPWDSIDVPVVMTSWGRMQKTEKFDTAQARAFYKTNLNRSPEPNAP
jgi:hypothetical protein